MPLKQKIRLYLVLVVLSAGFVQANALKSGISEFKQGNYEEALQHFLEAESTGNSSPQLYLNLGSTYFKLEQYRQSEIYFRRLLDYPKWHDLALFNTGLIAEKLGNNSLAQHYYLQVLQNSDNPKLKTLSEQRLDSTNVEWQQRTTLLVASLTMGQDDNAIAFADELQSNSTSTEDNFIDFYLFGQKKLNDSQQNRFYLQGYVYDKSYDEFNGLDVSVLGLSVLLDKTIGLDYGINLVSSVVDGETAYHHAQLEFTSRFPSSSRSWKISYLPSYIFGGDLYQQLDGWQHRLIGTRTWRGDFMDFRLRLTGETNNREDLTIESNQYSYSPKRLSIAARFKWRQSMRMEYSFNSVVTRSVYSGNNRFEDLDGVLKDEARKGTRYKINFELNYQLTRSLNLTGKLEHETNNENFDYYTYDRNQFSIGLDYTY